MKRYFPRAVPIGLLLLCSAMVGAQTTTPRPAASTQRITPNWNNVDIMVVAQGVGEVVGKTFIGNQTVRVNVNFVGTRALSPTELYAAFLNLLQVWGFAAVDAGNGVVKIVQEGSASKMQGSGQTSSPNGGGDEIVNATLETKNISALQVSQALRPFLSNAGALNFVPGTNTMLISDRASIVNYMRNILSSIDKPIDDTIEAITLENSTAADIVKSVKAAMPTAQPADAAGGQATQISSDDRTNSVLIRGNPAQRLSMRTLIATLDKPIDNGGGTQVRYLRNTRAETIAPKLKEIATGVAVVATVGPAGAPAAGANAAAAAAAAANNSVSIVADEFTNSLVITAPPKTMKSLMAAIDKLDIALAQVSITAIVADVSDTKAADIGVNWAEFSNKTGTKIPASSFVSPVGSATGNPVSLVDLIKGVSDPANADVIPGGATFAIGQLRDNGFNLGIMVRALRADSNTNVLMESNVTAMDNQEAKLENSQQVPLLSGSYTSGNGGGGGNNGNVNPFQTVNRTPVGTILTVTPQINGSNEMTLTINLESSGLTGASGDSGSLITYKRAITTSVRVASGDTIVIGGLIGDSKSTGENRIPWISRIPVLGELFKTRNGKREKTNLMVFIKPTIMMDGVQAGAVTDSKYKIIRDAELAQSAQKELLPVLPTDSPLLPELAPPPRSSAPAVGKP